eukprot:8103406-Lingulodinium_polyedra.AAC.1
MPRPPRGTASLASCTGAAYLWKWPSQLSSRSMAGQSRTECSTWWGVARLGRLDRGSCAAS